MGPKWKLDMNVLNYFNIVEQFIARALREKGWNGLRMGYNDSSYLYPYFNRKLHILNIMIEIIQISYL